VAEHRIRVDRPCRLAIRPSVATSELICAVSRPLCDSWPAANCRGVGIVVAERGGQRPQRSMPLPAAARASGGGRLGQRPRGDQL
jgi:hypothetical protein